MRISSITTLAGAGALALSLLACGAEPAEKAGPGKAAAPQPGGPAAAAQASDSVSGFGGVAGFAWGATREAIVARRGAPTIEREDFEGVKALGYPDVLMERPVILIFFLHPSQGLFRGTYGAQLAGVEECERVVSLFESGLARRFAGTEPARSGAAGPARCQSSASGGPGFVETWRSPDGGSRVALGLVPGARAVSLTYSTPAADEWERRKAATSPQR